MVEWHCESDMLSFGGNVSNERTNGVQKYGIRAENVGIQDGIVNLEVKFRDDWDKETEAVSFTFGTKKQYIDPDGAKWEVGIGTIVGDGTWATTSVAVCYYGSPIGDITGVVYDQNAKSGELVGVGPDVCNVGNLLGTFETRFYEGTTHLVTADIGKFEPGKCAPNFSEMLKMPDRDFVVMVRLYLKGTDAIFDEETVTIKLESAVMAPVITSVGTKEPPKICEPVQFISTVNWNDDGWKKGDKGTGLQKALWAYTRDDKEWDTECADELNWVQFSDESWPTYTFTEEHADIRHIRHTVVNKYGEMACAIISNFRFDDANGFVITVDPSLNGKPLIVWHVVPVPHAGIVVPDPDLYFSAFAFVRGTWNSASSDKVYKVKVGDIRTTANPTFDEMSLGTLQDGLLRDGFDCAILARESPSSMKFGFFKKEDVFKLHSGAPTCVNLMTASNDVLTEAIMGPVCDLFKIPRGPECESFWAEFYDPVFIANYASIITTPGYAQTGIGKDTLGNNRELSAFDHIALPFAVLGSLPVLSFLPFGAFVSKGLQGVTRLNLKFSDEAIGWMRSFTVPDIPNAIKPNFERGPINFFHALTQLSRVHAEDVLKTISENRFGDAAFKLKQYFLSDYGKAPLGDYMDMFQALRNGVHDDEAFLWLFEKTGLSSGTLSAVLNTLEKAAPSASELANANKLMDDAGILSNAADAVYDTLMILGDSPDELYSYTKNVLKNSPTVSAHVVAKHKSVLDKVVAGTGDITKEEVLAIFNHGEVSPDGIHDLMKSLDIARLIPKLADGNYKQVLGNFIDLTDSQYDSVAMLGKAEVDEWITGNSKIANKALTSSDPAAMSGLVYDAQKATANIGKIIDDVCGVR